MADSRDIETPRMDRDRLPGVFRARFQSEKVSGVGVVVNLSSRGLRLRTNARLLPGASLDISLLDAPDGPLDLRGLVRWNTELSPLLHPVLAFEAGILLENPTREFLALLDRENQRFVDFRGHPRFTRVFRVEMSGPGTWESTYALNLSRRGMFVMTNHEFVLGNLLEVRLFLMGAQPIETRCEVVYEIERDKAAETGSEPGVGLRILSMQPKARQVFQRYLDDLEERFGTV
jgi:Tfp pilus assembly protein PilZ